MLPNPGGEQLEQFRPRSATQIRILSPHSLSTLRQSLTLCPAGNPGVCQSAGVVHISNKQPHGLFSPIR